MSTEYSIDTIKIGIIGLGYVGLPLAVEFGKFFPVVGFDINQARVDELVSGKDTTLEVEASELSEAKYLEFFSDPCSLNDCNFYIITVPTPIDSSKRPNLSALESASRLVGTKILPSDIVVYESTVFPGCTEEVCVPLLEETSSLIFNKQFFCGYSPERINPGLNGRKFHLLAAASKTSCESMPKRLKINESSFMRAILTSLWVFSMTFAASATFIELAL